MPCLLVTRASFRPLSLDGNGHYLCIGCPASVPIRRKITLFCYCFMLPANVSVLFGVMIAVYDEFGAAAASI